MIKSNIKKGSKMTRETRGFFFFCLDFREKNILPGEERREKMEQMR